MYNKLIGVKHIDAHRIRIYKDGTYQNILDLISSHDGVVAQIQGGSGIHVTEIGTQQYLIENTAQGTQGPPGADSIMQTITINNGVGLLTYDSSVVSGLKSVGAAIGSLDDGILTISGLKGADAEPAQDGNDGAPAAMSNITVGGVTYSFDSLSNVVFNGTTATLDGSALKTSSPYKATTAKMEKTGPLQLCRI